MDRKSVCTDTDRQTWAHELVLDLTALPQLQRTAVQLIYAGGLLVSEVAIQLKLSIDETSAVIALALQALGRASLADPLMVPAVRSAAVTGL